MRVSLEEQTLWEPKLTPFRGCDALRSSASHPCKFTGMYLYVECVNF